MRALTQSALKAILSTVSEDERDRAIKYLSEDLLQKMDTLPAFTLEKPYDLTYDFLLDYVHYSWFVPTIASYDKKEANYFLLSFDEKKAKKIALIIDVSKEKKLQISSSGKKYFEHLLLASLIGEQPKILPLSFLPSSILNGLIKLTKKQLVLLISHLSLYDLAKEIPQIVETKILKKIYSFLGSEQTEFLKKLMEYKEPFSRPPLRLDRWDGNEKNLYILMQKLGINRLSQALSVYDPQLIWYVSHRLDIGRGALLNSLCEKKASKDVADILSKNILEVFPILKH